MVDLKGEPIKFVTVTSEGKKGLSDENGYYLIKDIEITEKEKLLVSFEKDNYAINQRVIPVSSEKTNYTANSSLTKYHHVSNIDANSASPQTVSMTDPDNVSGAGIVEIDFPANSITASGMVSVNVVRGDPSTEEGRSIFPGEYFGSDDTATDGGTTLESVAFTEITLLDEQGNDITQLNYPATVSMKLPNSLQAEYVAGDTIPWWSYDESNGIWVREDADPETEALDDATVIDRGGLLYVQAKVAHFSWWNADYPIQNSCVCASVTDENGTPISGINLRADGITYNSRSNPQLTNNQGKACVIVKKSTDQNNREKVRLQAEYGSYQYPYNTTDTEEGDVGTPVIKTSLESSGSLTISNPAVCLTVRNTIPVITNGLIEGTIYDSDGLPVSNLSFFNSAGDEITTNEVGEFSLKVPLGTATLYKAGLFFQSVTVTDPTTPTIVNITLPNKEPWIQSFESTINRSLISGETAHFTTQAVDPEGKTLSYQWTIDGGYTLDIAGDGASARFTAPTGTGFATVTLVVTDDKGSQTKRLKGVSWGVTDDSQNLRLTIVDSKQNPTPLAGIVVVLHDPVSGEITERRVSNENGVVDFGYIGRNRATYTTVFKNDTDCERYYGGNTYLETHVDVPSGNNIYYLEQMNKGGYHNEWGWNCYNAIYSEAPSRFTQFATFDLKMTSVPIESYSASRSLKNIGSKPGYISGSASGSGTEWEYGESIYYGNLDESELLDIVVYARDYITDEIIAYDFIQDIPVTLGEHYQFEVDLTRTPINIPYVIDGYSPSASVTLTYETDSYVRPFQHYLLQDQVSGQIPIMSEINIDRYNFLLRESHTPSLANPSLWQSTWISQSYVTLPNMFDLSGYGNRYFDDIRFSNDQFDFSLTGNFDVLWVDISATCDAAYDTGVSWKIWLKPDTTHWSVVEKPEEISDCMADMNNVVFGEIEPGMGQKASVSFQAYDYNITNGFDEVWQKLINGEDIDQQSTSVYNKDAWDVFW